MNNEYCYHHRVSDTKTIDFYRQEIMNYEETFSYLKSIHEKNTVMVYDPQDLNKTGNILNIEYQAPNQKLKGEFSSMVNNELIMRGMDISLPLTVRLDNLKQYLIMENEIEKMKAVLENRNRLQIQRTPYISLEQAIICILHLENRVGETLLKFFLTNSLEAITNDTHMTEEEVRQLFQEKMNREIFGNENKPSQWEIPIDPSQKVLVSAIMFDNRMARIVVEKMESLVNISGMNNEQIIKWKKCLAYYKEMIKMLRQKEDFLDEQIEEFQVLADNFFSIWVNLHGSEGVTNYIHMIGSGHISYYLFQWRNLYRYSQQGWESLNHYIKTVYHQRTQKGGSQGTTGGPSSKVKGIGVWMQRLIM